MFYFATSGGNCEPATPTIWQPRLHHAGDLWLYALPFGTIGNGPGFGEVGINYDLPMRPKDLDALKINWIPSLEFPGGSKLNYLYTAAPMIGCIKNTDTLVSTCLQTWYGFLNEFNAFQEFIQRSTHPSSPHFNPVALADEEYSSIFSDTAVAAIPRLGETFDEIDHRIHEPIGLEVVQTSRAWSEGNSKRFVIFDLWFKNISSSVLREPCIGLIISPTAFHYEGSRDVPGAGLMSGFLGVVPAGPDSSSNEPDSVGIAWMSDNSGEPGPNGFSNYSPTSAIGFRVLRAPEGKLSFNWWGAYSQATGIDGTWGPRKLENGTDYTARRAWPLGDRSVYQLMTNGEIDYDNMYSAINYSAQGWAPPTSDALLARSLAAGTAGMTLHLSCGPLPDIPPGDSVPFTYAIFAGENFHTRPENHASNFNPNNPQTYRENLDFRELILSARAADWFFDNPGVDTDGDGYAGKFYLENCSGQAGIGCDTVWFKGDGIPDWGGPKSPPAPVIDLTSEPNRVTLRWVGAASETAIDQLSRQRDFEGYKVYSARTNTSGDYALIAAWDIPDDYYRLAYEPRSGTWRQVSYPLTIDGWRRALGDAEFDPRDYSRPSLINAYKDIIVDTVRDASGNIIRIVNTERLSYWAAQGPNHGNTYPDGGTLHDNRIQRIEVRDTVIGEDTLQYGVYEMTMDNLNAAIPLWFSVTTLDYGDFKRNVEPLEGGTGANATFAFPVYSADAVIDSGLGVTVYPNPYKIAFPDAQGRTTNYYAQGYEGYGLPAMNEHERRIWFANLPDTATIRIYSLDGDLIRTIEHPDKHLTRYSSIVGWDLISRNTQAVVSGIYIWRVDSRLGSQVGKIVIIK